MPADRREARLACMTRAAALAHLHAAGVPAEAVLEDQALAFHEDAGHRRAGLHASYSHAVYGRLEQVGAFWDFDDLPLSLGRAPPALGEHSREVWEMLGLSAAQIRELEAHGLTKLSTSNRSPEKTT
jgi:crotonobetainyl-CoA:carnitine CoA-transferase CaiB-like acyl-CoA transferase